MPLGRIGDYELLESLGKGGMSVVFKARDSRLGRTVALKILPEEFASDPEHRARLMREAKAGAALSHSGIAACLDANEAELEPPDLLAPGSPGPHPKTLMYIAMEYVPGTDLTALISGRPLPIDRVVDIGIQMTAALESAHTAGVIHRDLKPANVRVMQDGRIKIIDFGLARLVSTDVDASTITDLTSGGRILGTSFYMSPEQANGKPVDPRSDLFSLGTLLYQLVTSHLPFEGDTYNQVLYNVTNLDPPPLARYASQVPIELERIVRKLLEKDPGRRYQSAHDVRNDLERLAEAESAPALWSALRHSLRGWRGGALAAVVAIAVAAVVWWPSARSRSLAVMPFVNRTGDPSLDPVGEGLAYGVFGDLVRGANLNVASFSSTLGLARELPTDPKVVARGLGVGSVLAGSLHRSGGGVTVDVELVDGKTGSVKWTERYDYAASQALAIEDGIVRSVAHALSGRVPTNSGWLTTRSPGAYDLYLRAGALLANPFNKQAAERALELLDQALALDPDFALAWAGESRARILLWNRDKDPESLRRAEEAADRASRLNPDLVEGHLARAQLYRVTNRYADAIRELEAVRAINPSWDEVELQLGSTYRDMRNLEQAEAHLRRAIGLRPDYWRAYNQLGGVLIRRADYDGAREAYRAVLRLGPDPDLGYEQLANTEQWAGNFKASSDAYERISSPVADGSRASNMGTAYFFQGRAPEARRYFQLAIDLEPRNPTWHTNLADWHLRAGQADSARAEYTEASRLIDELLMVKPTDVALRLDRTYCQAKLGDCPGAAAALTTLTPSLPDSDFQIAHEVARIEAFCGRRERALAALDRAVAYGVPARVVRAEDEFHRYLGDPKFEAVLARRP